MTFQDFAPVLHVIGFLAASAIYGMLLVMCWRAGWSDATRFPFAAGALGLVWNLGKLLDTLQELGLPEMTEYLDALTYAALALLPAVVVHSILREQSSRAARILTAAGYSVSGAAAVGHFANVAVNGFAPLPDAAHLLGPTYGLLLVPLVLLTGSQSTWRRALWLVALAIFALTGSEIANHSDDSLLIDLVGHHASFALAFVILYQEYRFALADRVLKQALTIIALVSIAMGSYVVVVPWLGEDLFDPRVMGGVLTLWIATALVYPSLTGVISRVVDRWVLGRDSYGELRAVIAAAIEESRTSAEVLNRVRDRLGLDLNASRVEWQLVADDGAEIEARVEALGGRLTRKSSGTESVWVVSRGASAVVLVPTAELPQYIFSVSELSEGRRLGSEDAVFLEWLAVRVARRIDRLRVVNERYEHELREKEMGKLATEAELKALRAQINPHFLFNALTTIGHLIQTAPERAMETLLNLTELLRRVLRSTDEWTSLGEELDLVTAYLDIEKARFEERLDVELDVPEALRPLKVPSLILQPLVENAVKHGIAPMRQGGRVRVSAERSGDTLTLRVDDTGAGWSDAALEGGRGNGVGLKNVQERLRGYYGSDASLSLSPGSPAGASVELRLPVPQNVSEVLASSNR